MRISAIFFGFIAFAGPAHASEVVCTAIADATDGRILLQRGDCDRQVTPASTFKIAISLMGFDAGFLMDVHNPALPFREGDAAWNPSWRRTVDPESWIRDSVVWYSQRVTRALGADRFRAYVTRFSYGNADVSGDAGKADGLTRAWLSSSLAISPLEQVAFLSRLVRYDLPVSDAALAMTETLTQIGPTSDGWEIHGKTGTGFPRNPDGSLDETHGYGWFVGWARRGAATVVFARLIQDDRRETGPAGIRARAAMIAELPQVLTEAGR
ncbi:class D beta-lactamase [Methylobacterium sp. GXS13]|uniref:class D beta-lactamase n=1 Tax=Methylobacterium sp. GXS13 TaxID=1730094 RepID=UPI001FCCD1E1|nr:class D beta-lactamase [Methylobacterium sp. GXS13]